MPLYKEAPTNPKKGALIMPTVSGKAMWASITQPNTTYEPVWSINLVVDEATAKEFTDKGYGSSVVKQKPVSWGDESEQPTLIIKRKVQGPGFERTAPELVSDKRDTETGKWVPLNCNVGNGSEVTVKYKEWESTRQGTTYKGLDLVAVQVNDLVEYETDNDEF